MHLPHAHAHPSTPQRPPPRPARSHRRTPSTPHPPLHLTIPSPHDSLPLQATLNLPSQPSHKLAVLSHPYPPLGGTLHDPVLQALMGALVHVGWTVLLVNLRGTRGSGGRTSWTGAAEAADFSGVVEWGVSFISGVGAGEGAEVLVGGYSYGALVAGRSRVREGVVVEEAWGMGRRYGRGEGRRGVRAVRGWWYLFVSPPLGVVRGLLMVGAGGESVLDAGTVGGRERVRGVMAVWGDADGFTGVRRYRRWGREMEGVLGARWRGVEVAGAGHFWGEGEVREMARWVREWAAGDPPETAESLRE